VIETGEPTFYRNAEGQGPFLNSVPKNTDFEVHSSLTVPLQTTITLGAIQVLNKELDGGTGGDFTEKDLMLLQEVAEYTATLIHRMVDPKYVPRAEDTARFVAQLTELPLVTSADDIEIDAELVKKIGASLIRSEGIFPYKRHGENSVAVLMANPLDYARREMFAQVAEMAVEEVSVISVVLFENLLKKYFGEEGNVSPPLEGVNVGA